MTIKCSFYEINKNILLAYGHLKSNIYPYLQTLSDVLYKHIQN